MPLFSVIIPVYNSAGTLARALESVFSQTFVDYEVVIVDDGSTDQIDSVVSLYADRVKFVRQKNAGAAAARNHGVKVSVGEFLAFLDADDFWHPRKLQIQADVFRKYPDIAICCSMGCKIRPEALDEASKVYVSDAPQVELISNFEQIFLDPYLGTPGVAIPRALFTSLGGFREELTSAEDVDLWLRASYTGVVAKVWAPLFFVVGSRFSLTSLHGDGTFQDNLRIVDDFCAENQEFFLSSEPCVRRVKAKIYENWGSAALVRREKLLAIKVLRSSLREKVSLRAVYLLFKAMLIVR